MDFINETEKATPIRKQCDVFVAGGGIAGISAALSAARGGAKVILAEKQCALGGLATLGLITIYLPLCDGMGRQVIFGIGEELLRLSILHGAEARFPKPWLEDGTLEERVATRFQVQYNPWMFAMLAEELLLSEGVEILYDAHVTGVVQENGRICSVLLDNKEGHWAAEVQAVVDATGDADLCLFAGESTETFRENRFAAWHYLSGEQGWKLHAHAAPLYGELPEPFRFYDGTSTDDVSAMVIDGHKSMMARLLDLRARKGDVSLVPAAIPLVPSFRMTRRLKGLYELDESEEKTRFPDSVGLTGDWRNAGPVFEIPFRSLIGTVPNLITAGRCISVTTAMWDITRVIPTCAVTGEAAGAAASLLVHAQASSFQSVDVTNLQRLLHKNGVLVHKNGNLTENS